MIRLKETVPEFHTFIFEAGNQIPQHLLLLFSVSRA